MRRLKLETGGRPFSNDDLQVLQELADGMSSSLFKDKGAFIISGCEVSGLTIGPGYLFIDGEIIRLTGHVATVFPVYMSAGTEIDDVSQLHQDGNSKATQKYRAAAASEIEPPASGEYITFTVDGGRTFFDAIAELLVIPDGSIDEDKIADNSVNGNHIVNESVGESKLSNGSVTVNKIAGNSVGTGHLQTGSVTESKIQDNAVTSVKIANGNISLNKLHSDVLGKLRNPINIWKGSTNLRVNISGQTNRVYSHLQAALEDSTYHRFRVAFTVGLSAGSSSVAYLRIMRTASAAYSSPVQVRELVVDVGSDNRLFSIEAIDVDFTGATGYYHLEVYGNGGTLNVSQYWDGLLYVIPYSS